MKKSSLNSYIEGTKDKWMTPDLLGKVQGDQNLLQGLADPEIMKAVALMQANPKLAKEQFKDNKKVTEFFTNFSKLMGGHFEDLSKKEGGEQTTKKVEPDKPMIEELSSTTSKTPYKTAATTNTKTSQQPIDFSSADPVLAKKLEDPTVKSLMADPKIQAFLASLHKGPPLDFYQLAKQDPELAMKVRYLLERGVLQAQSNK